MISYVCCCKFTSVTVNKVKFNLARLCNIFWLVPLRAQRGVRQENLTCFCPVYCSSSHTETIAHNTIIFFYASRWSSIHFRKDSSCYFGIKHVPVRLSHHGLNNHGHCFIFVAETMFFPVCPCSGIVKRRPNFPYSQLNFFVTFFYRPCIGRKTSSVLTCKREFF
ncbi:hypothetical protein SDC9_144665 [bioreactor metagenome]|uniref:Uncharacterized protein n=1 Tax=bioreactor metagenome TaxID=1076179 RepID=A0A645EA45_9ZZZZ